MNKKNTHFCRDGYVTSTISVPKLSLIKLQIKLSQPNSSSTEEFYFFYNNPFLIEITCQIQIFTMRIFFAFLCRVQFLPSAIHFFVYCLTHKSHQLFEVTKHLIWVLLRTILTITTCKLFSSNSTSHNRINFIKFSAPVTWQKPSKGETKETSVS